MSPRPSISSFVVNFCTLDPESWHSYSDLHELYLATERVEYSDDLLTRPEFIAALRTVPGFRAERRKGVRGCYGVLLDERAPKDQAGKAFELLGLALSGSEFKPEDVTTLARADAKIATALVEGGCVKTNPRTVLDWLMACRDYSRAGYVLRRTFREKDNLWRTWRFEKIARK